jgi:aminoglycoside 2'-N-acetyltransferase I
MVETRRLSTEEVPFAELRLLFDDAFAGDFSDDDWEHTVGGVHVVVCDSGSIISHASVVPRSIWIDDHLFAAGYVEGVATLVQSQDRGFASLVMAEVGLIIHETYELGVLSTGSLSFYERLGWECWEGATWVRTQTGPVRTPDDDGGIMILRTSNTGELAPGASIACEERSGDDW